MPPYEVEKCTHILASSGRPYCWCGNSSGDLSSTLTLQRRADRCYDSTVRVLIVEDEPKSAAYLRKGLSEHGYVADLAGNGEDGLRLAQNSEYDLLILDIMLPRRDGWSVITALRRTGKQTPVLFLTARDSVPDRVKGLDLGADDYLVKPFAFSELLARIRTILRRGPSRRSETLRFADLELDPLSHKAVRAGKRLDLTPKEFLLLSLFVRRASEVLSRTLIAEQVWDMNFDCGTNVVDVHVRRLRSKVDDPFERKLIRTIRGVGYVLEG
jgi:two-component system copper resistance phosphate regulon response regulator CusR